MAASSIYEKKRGDLQVCVERAEWRSAAWTVALGLFLVLLLGLSWLSIRHRASVAWALGAATLAAVSAWRWQQHRRAQFRSWRLLRYYERASERVRGEWAGSGESGEEFDTGDQNEEHRYARDLQVFGEGSLFEMLCTARTAIGRRGLAIYLKAAPALQESRRRQEAVRELRDEVELREQVALAGDFETFDSNWETFARWLALPAVPFSGWVRAVALASSSAILCAIAAGAVGVMPWRTVGTWIAPAMALHAVLGLVYRARVRRMLADIAPVSIEIRAVRAGLRLVADREFQCGKLREIAETVRAGAAGLGKLDRLLGALNERNKDWFYVPFLVLLASTQLCMAVEQWRVHHREALRNWLEAWGEFEALQALANYAYENPEDVFPELIEEGPAFEAAALGHPLLAHEACVRNAVELNAATRFYVVSGSNMSGKSTLLRAIGLNAVLAFAGAPVRARSLRISAVSVCASLSVVDSPMNGRSKFMAEMERLRQAVEAARAGEPVLFLIDEILSGTNSQDRRVAGEAVVRTLLGHGAIGALSTHDLSLAEIALPELGGVNMHTGSREGGGPLDFDYLLKPGVSRESNGLAIARMAGVPV